jgi:putative drug exporter of the RND superfamily
VFLIGIGIAIDYSLLIVYRFREELAHGADVEPAVVRTMQTAGRAVIFSGATVAIGLALLIFMPLPFVRAIGIGGFLLPVVSVFAAATLQPALLSIYGRRGTRRVHRRRLRPQAPAASGPSLGRSAGRRRAPLLGPYGAVDHAQQVALRDRGRFATHRIGDSARVAPTHARGDRRDSPEPPVSSRAGRARDALGPGAVAPAQVLVHAGVPGGAREPRVQAAIGRLVTEVRADPEVSAVYFLPGGRFLDRTGRYAQVIVATRHEYGSEAAQSFANRLRHTVVAKAAFPAGVDVRADGASPQGVDFLHVAYGAFPWLVLAGARAHVPAADAGVQVADPVAEGGDPEPASVAAAYGALVVVFRFGLGKDVLGLYQFPQIEGWIPIFLFAMLFGLSMDYEVFLFSRMREEWDATHDNERAVELGLERTGRIITAAAVIMVAAFCGFLAGSIVGLQEFGAGLAVAILLDATVVRAVMVPALMAVMGRYNWWLPARVARVVRVQPSPLRAP